MKIRCKEHLLAIWISYEPIGQNLTLTLALGVSWLSLQLNHSCSLTGDCIQQTGLSHSLLSSDDQIALTNVFFGNHLGWRHTTLSSKLVRFPIVDA